MIRTHQRIGQRVMTSLGLLGLLFAPIATSTVQRTGTSPIVRVISLTYGLGPPVLDRLTGHAFFRQVNSRYVHVLDTATGTFLRSIAVGVAREAIRNIIVEEKLDRVFVLTEPSSGTVPLIAHITALDAQTAQVLFDVPVTVGGDVWGNVVDPVTHRLFVLGVPDYLDSNITSNPARDAVRVTILDAITGRVIHTLALRPTLHWSDSYFRPTPPIVLNTRTNHVFVSLFDRNGVLVLDASSGQYIKTILLPPLVPGLEVNPHGNSLVTSDYLGRVYAIGERGMFSASTFKTQEPGMLTTLDASSGRVLHAVPTGTDTFAIIDAPTRRVFAISDGGDGKSSRITVLNALSGAVIGSVPHGTPLDPFEGQSVVDERSGQVIILTPGHGTLSVLDGTSGHPRYTIAIGSNPNDLAVDAQRGRVFVVSAGPRDRRNYPKGVGRLSVLDEQTGVVSKTIVVGRNPISVTLDEIHARAFVFSTGTPTVSGDLTVLDTSRL